jgi:hypothetical protein
MNKTERIIIDAEPQDVISALIRNNDIPEGFEVKEFTYTLSKITDKNLLSHMDMREYKITHCRIVLEKKGGS